MPKPQRRSVQPAASGRDDSLLANIALLYYKEGLNQGEIAKRTGLSRATVVNYLREARERGIVDIRVQGKPMSVSQEARQLRDRFGLEDVYVADTSGEADPALTLRHTARVAAAAFYDIVAPGDRIGLAWGHTMKLMADELSEHPVPDTEVCQIIGAMDTTQLLATETCAIEIASKISAVCHTLHAPAVLSSADLAAALRTEPAIRTQLDRLGALSCLFTSVGNLDASGHLVASGIITIDELAEVRAKGGVGFICNRFLDRDGNCVPMDLYQRMIAANREDILNPSKRVVVASGMEKLEAIGAALRGGYVSHLIVDREIAGALIGLDAS